MNQRAMLFSVFLAFGATLSFVPRAAADHYDRYRGSYDRCEAGAAARVRKDRAMIRKWEGTGRHQGVVRWAHEDLAKVRRDLANCRAQARNERYNDRYQARNDRYYDRDVDYDPYDNRPVYDPSYDRDPYYGNDPYYGSDRGFDFKRDWPLVLGTVLNAQIGR